jgi:hypothetical protein
MKKILKKGEVSGYIDVPDDFVDKVTEQVLRSLLKKFLKDKNPNMPDEEINSIVDKMSSEEVLKRFKK